MIPTCEFQVHAEAYFRLKKHFKDVRPEHRFRSNGESCIADLVIFEKNKPVLILEVKRSPIRPKIDQLKRYYRISGVPAVYVCGIREARRVVRTARFYMAIGKENGKKTH